MKLNVWKLVLLALMFAVPAAGSQIMAQAKDKGKMDKKDDASKKKKQIFTLKSTKLEGSKGTSDPNVKDDSDVNQSDADFAGPKEKKPNSRGASGVCEVVLDNRTALKIKIYVDGSYRGLMAPYGDSTTYTGAGPTRVYARAEFEDGSSIYWGPTDYTCYDGQYINFIMER